jgi:hypothetical protein
VVQYDDLPEELAKLFGDSRIPEVIRDVIRSGWGRMKPNEQGQLLRKLRDKRDKLERILIAVTVAARVLLTQPPNEVIEF